MSDLIEFVANLPGEVTTALVTTIVQYLLTDVYRRAWHRLARRRTTFGSGPWADRRFLILTSFLVVALGAVVLLFTAGSANRMTVLFVSILFIFLILVREISSFWHFGFNYIEKSISADTYQRAFQTCRSNFRILGTNAFSFADLEEFEEMLQRIRETGGSVTLLFAHPNSNGLREAAKSRGCSETLYGRQGQYSLGRLFELTERLSLPIELRLYDAENMHDLPIFRSMFLDNRQCVSSVAVYGREDHGANFPQIIAKAPTDSRTSTIYGILNRYFNRLWYNSAEPSLDEITTFRNFYIEARSNPSLMSELKQ
jgi:hypothetical protein